MYILYRVARGGVTFTIPPYLYTIWGVYQLLYNGGVYMPKSGEVVYILQGRGDFKGCNLSSL